MPTTDIPSSTGVLRSREPVAKPLALVELTELLIKHYGLHEGRYDLLVEYRIAVGPMGPASDKLPGAAVAVAAIGLVATDVVATTTVDASEVNPAKVARRGNKARAR
jgi:hypothetical protein